MIRLASEVLKALKYTAGRIDAHLVENTGDLALMYHGVTRGNYKELNKRHTPAYIFDGQLKVFSRYYEIVSVADFFDNNVKINKPKLCITFDDGYVNNLETALPIIKKHHIPASFYITGLNNTEYPVTWPDVLDLLEPLNIGKWHQIEEISIYNRNGMYIDERTGQTLREIIRYKYPDWNFKCKVFEALGFNFDVFKKTASNELWKLMSDIEIKQLSTEPLVEIGSHGYFHNNLGSLSEIEAKSEIKQSIDYLEKLISKQIKTIAYPDGSYNEQTKQLSEELGIKYHFAADGFRVHSDSKDIRIKDRKGLYNCGRPHTQLLDIYK